MSATIELGQRGYVPRVYRVCAFQPVNGLRRPDRRGSRTPGAPFTGKVALPCERSPCRVTPSCTRPQALAPRIHGVIACINCRVWHAARQIAKTQYLLCSSRAPLDCPPGVPGGSLRRPGAASGVA